MEINSDYVCENWGIFCPSFFSSNKKKTTNRAKTLSYILNTIFKIFECSIINCVLHYDKLLYSRINIISFKNENKWERKLIIEENLILFDTKLKIINY